jgi:acyl dehydratase
MTLTVDTPDDLLPYVGQNLGTGPWLTIDQPMIDAFARITLDHNWIHTDPARAATDMPDGKTIAHGCLTLSLLAGLSAAILEIRQRKTGINYGYNNVRFLAPVQVGSRIRAHQDLEAYDSIPAGGRLTIKSTVEIENKPKPALVAVQIVLAYV